MARRKPRQDTRLNHADSEARGDRAMTDRQVTEDRELTDDERLNEFRMSMFQSALPDLPLIDGFHVCWLTTTNPRDSIPARMRLGYEPIRAHEIPGWEHTSVKTGEYEGMIGVNEMVAFKLPMQLYEAYMYEAHHRAPLEEEGKLDTARQMAMEEANSQARSAVALETEEGYEGLGEAPEPPAFEETLSNPARI